MTLAQSKNVETAAYDEAFYRVQVADSLRSARLYLAHLWTYLKPASVLDAGCARGAWLKACHELGCNTLFGVDGDWNNQSQMLDPSIRFRSVNLDEPFSLPQRVDLAITLEVAEHIQPRSAATFIDSLTSASDAIIFGAAYTAQGGVNHFNEQPHTYWAKLFLAKGYVPFDLFRPVFWGNEDVCFWYRQNTFLYLKKDSAPYTKVKAAGLSEMADIAFMDCVHPELYAIKIGSGAGFRAHVTDIIPSLFRALENRLARKPGQSSTAFWQRFK
jgi:hypothetical protein